MSGAGETSLPVTEPLLPTPWSCISFVSLSLPFQGPCWGDDIEVAAKAAALLAGAECTGMETTVGRPVLAERLRTREEGRFFAMMFGDMEDLVGAS